jgi:hypothetical protein
MQTILKCSPLRLVLMLLGGLICAVPAEAGVFAIALAISLPGSCGGGPTCYGEREPKLTRSIQLIYGWSYRLEKCVPDGTEVFFIGAIITSPKSVLFTERNTP